MKIRDLKVPAWPPAWGSSFGRGDKLAGSYDGVLESVERIENRLRLRIKYDGADYAGILEWEPPPALEAVEKILRQHVGQQITAISELEV
jgi:hypothetical protein